MIALNILKTSVRGKDEFDILSIVCIWDYEGGLPFLPSQNPGDIFGELSLLEGEVYDTNAQAVEESYIYIYSGLPVNTGLETAEGYS